MLTDLSDLLRPEAIGDAVALANKKSLFAWVGAAAAATLDIDARFVADRLAERERRGSTGFGGGVAIPHAKIDGLPRVVGFFVRLAQPIDFQAVDDAPVDLVFALLSPVGSGAAHLKALARVSRRLRDAGFLARLRGAGSPDALYALFADEGGRDAA